ncbi:MAG: exodeoxyribonuclease VII small subunit [Oscillospiraceae bacterium]|nr:exodeoxyribonuclease VII small subunit [Oscillospiraceae bacterium]
MDFENSMKRLSEISDRMSGADLPLEESVKLYAEAAQLVKDCKEYIENAKLRVEQLERGGEV